MGKIGPKNFLHFNYTILGACCTKSSLQLWNRHNNAEFLKNIMIFFKKNLTPDLAGIFLLHFEIGSKNFYQDQIL